MKNLLFCIVLFAMTGCASFGKGSAEVELSFGEWVSPVMPSLIFKVSIEQRQEVTDAGSEER